MAVADFLGATFLSCCDLEDLDLEEAFFLGDPSESAEAEEALLLLAAAAADAVLRAPFLAPAAPFLGEGVPEAEEAEEARLERSEALERVLRRDLREACKKRYEP